MFTQQPSHQSADLIVRQTRSTPPHFIYPRLATVFSIASTQFASTTTAPNTLLKPTSRRYTSSSGNSIRRQTSPTPEAPYSLSVKFETTPARPTSFTLYDPADPVSTAVARSRRSTVFKGHCETRDRQRLASSQVRYETRGVTRYFDPSDRLYQGSSELQSTKPSRH